MAEHLPAYVALQPWATGRRVLVVAPASLAGPRRLAAAGAAAVHVAQTSESSEPGLVCTADWPPTRQRFDLVAVLESYAGHPSSTRATWLARARGQLEPRGWLAAWAPHDDGCEVDFWTLEEELGAQFEHVYMLAQLPWRGVSLAPVLGDTDRVPTVILDEGLLAEPPEASHYLALGTRRAPSEVELALVTGRCLLVPAEPSPGDEVDAQMLEDLRSAAQEAEAVARRRADQVATAERELAEAKAALESATQRLRDEGRNHEDALRRAQAEAEDRVQEQAEAMGAQLRRARSEAEALVHERSEAMGAELRRARAEAEARARKQVEALEAELRRLRADGDAQAKKQSAALEAEFRRVRVEDESRIQQRVEALEAELARARTEAKTARTDLAILTRSAQDLEAAVARANETAARRETELDQRELELSNARTRLESVEAERASLARQMEVALAEREGARQLADRVEAELQLTRRRLAEQEDALARRAAEASKLSTEVEVARAELEHHKSMLARAQSREEQLSASAAQGAEQGRMLAEVANDRERVREEMGRQAQQIQGLEERLWSSREDLEKARLDNVRLAADVERLRDRAERAHQSELKQAEELQRLNGELHELELGRAELGGTVRAQDEEIARLRAQTEAYAGDSQEVAVVRTQLAERGRQLSEAAARSEQLAAREREALSLVKRREAQLSELSEELARLRRTAEKEAARVLALEGEMEVKSLETEQLAASVGDLQAELETRREGLESARRGEEQARRALERSQAEQESLRRRLRERDQELEDVTTANETSGVELHKLRRELEAAAQASEELEQALDLTPSEGSAAARPSPGWPEDAVRALRRLQAQLAAQSRRHAEQLAAQARSNRGPRPPDHRLEMLRLEAKIRAEEQEVMLRQLDAAEQQIWEMTGAADRNAARLAASLAQLEKHKEELDETRDELEVARKQLEAAEARGFEQGRQLAAERARLARVGADTRETPSASFEEGIDELFAEFKAPAGETPTPPRGESSERAEVQAPPMVELSGHDSAAPVRHLPRSSASRGEPAADVLDSSGGPRVVVESLEDDPEMENDPWSRGVAAAPASQRAEVAPEDAARPSTGSHTPKR